MKKLFYTLIALLTMTATQSNAQAVFNSVLESAQHALKDPVQNFSKTQIAKFKIDALNYLKSQTSKYESIKRNDLLDIQSYYMSEFISKYLTEIICCEGQPDSVKKAIVFLFVNASAVCPLFNDKDKDKINKYINSDKQLTPFCLDTDWKNNESRRLAGFFIAFVLPQIPFFGARYLSRKKASPCRKKHKAHILK